MPATSISSKLWEGNTARFGGGARLTDHWNPQPHTAHPLASIVLGDPSWSTRRSDGIPESALASPLGGRVVKGRPRLALMPQRILACRPHWLTAVPARRPRYPQKRNRSLSLLMPNIPGKGPILASPQIATRRGEHRMRLIWSLPVMAQDAQWQRLFAGYCKWQQIGLRECGSSLRLR